MHDFPPRSSTCSPKHPGSQKVSVSNAKLSGQGYPQAKCRAATALLTSDLHWGFLWARTAALSYSHKSGWTFKEQLNSSFCLGQPSVWPIADLDYERR